VCSRSIDQVPEKRFCSSAGQRANNRKAKLKKDVEGTGEPSRTDSGFVKKGTGSSCMWLGEDDKRPPY